MEASSFLNHMERPHGILLPRVRGVDIGRGGPDTHKVSLPRILKSVECLVEG